MAVDTRTVREIAGLARLRLDSGEVEQVARDLEQILELVARMEAVDVGGLEPMAHPLDLPARMRPDEVTEGNQRERLLALAPATEDGLYLVPRVVE